ncbi:hypothetical protein BD408DRAFT_440977 [Parasitella parasitica]|nr:hypothetical protein BD408DRAFT_440977 [Parasitella parasitica]
MKLFGSFNNMTTRNKHLLADASDKDSVKMTSTLVDPQLPDIWRRMCSVSKKFQLQDSKKGFHCRTFDFSLANQNSYYHDSLVPQSSKLSPFISQAISSKAIKKMTLEEIKRWLQENVENRTKAKDVELCLKNCGIFLKVVVGGIVYWQLKYDRLELQPFGQNILDTGVAGGIEFWQGEHPMMDM